MLSSFIQIIDIKYELVQNMDSSYLCVIDFVDFVVEGDILRIIFEVVILFVQILGNEFVFGIFFEFMLSGLI